MTMTKNKLYHMVLAGILCAIGIVVPMFMPRIVLGPMSFTLASHVAVFLGMFISPAVAVADAEQVVILVLASHGLLDTLPTAEQREKTAAFVRQFRADVSGTMQKIDADGKLEPDRVDAILNAWKAYAGGNDHVVQ